MAGIADRRRVACAVLLAMSVTAACGTKAPFEPSLPTATGFRVDGDVLKLWTGTPCNGVTGVTVTFDSGTTRSAEQAWSAPPPGVLLERMDLLRTSGEPPPDTAEPLRVRKTLVEGYDWTKSDSINFSVDGPSAYGARVDVGRVLDESARHPSDSYLFGGRGWMDAADVERENQKSFLTVCTPDSG
ncbi:hypothetical protein [Saccharothrix sp. Mg75]|uniref:hypothetical protein n=1 Tax=Saccharothrix sp. Mg75 TaxID=3445357 RepID=UPI003EE82C75